MTKPIAVNDETKPPEKPPAAVPIALTLHNQTNRRLNITYEQEQIVIAPLGEKLLVFDLDLPPTTASLRSIHKIGILKELVARDILKFTPHFILVWYPYAAVSGLFLSG
jgi:hypothetical protein